MVSPGHGPPAPNGCLACRISTLAIFHIQNSHIYSFSQPKVIFNDSLPHWIIVETGSERVVGIIIIPVQDMVVLSICVWGIPPQKCLIPYLPCYRSGEHTHQQWSSPQFCETFKLNNLNILISGVCANFPLIQIAGL